MNSNWKVSVAVLMILGCLVSQQAPAQVASNSLFYGQMSTNPAVTFYREESTVSYLYLSGTGKTETVAGSYNTNETEEITISRNALLLTLKQANWALEAIYDLKNENNIDNKTGSSSSVATSGNPYKTEVNHYSIAVGMPINANLTAGANYTLIETTVPDFKIVNKDQKLGLGISYQIIENLFLGLDSNYVMTEETGRANNNWLELGYGLSYAYQINPDSRLRFEYGIVSSQEDIAEESGSDDAHYHRATNDTMLSVEWAYQQFKFAYKSQTAVISPLSGRSSESEDRTVQTSFGLAYLSESNNFYVELFKHQAERTRGEYTNTASDLLELNLGTRF